VTDANPYLIAELIEAGLNRREARWLLEEFGADDHESLAALRRAAQRRLAGEPLQYVIGHWPFRSLDLDLDPRVLIPRPETEELVGVALAQLAGADVTVPVIVDLGCGSGAVGLALLAELAERGVVASLVALDQSPDALAVARQNALKHGLHAVSFVRSSWFEALDPSLRGRVDLVVANPPYVGAEEFASLDPVLGYEPLGALVALDTAATPGFADLEAIIGESLAWLAPGGRLVCEHGHMQREAVLNAARAAGFVDVADLDDMAGWPRILVARRP
jgi:release factor glutamine methyltransferase